MATTSTARRPARTSFGAYPGRPSPPLATNRPFRPARWALGAVLRIAGATLLPVVALIGTSVGLHSRGYGTLAAVAGGAAVGLGILAIAAASISHSLTGRARIGTLSRWVALPAVLLWCGYALLHFERANAKTDEVRGAYTSLHPILRLAVSTAILADGALVVTDARRSADDYRRMGLPIFDRTMHYRQANGWVHAVDVRTIGHGELRNLAVAAYFRAVGLRVVRHVGTADHLHVELPLAR